VHNLRIQTRNNLTRRGEYRGPLYLTLHSLARVIHAVSARSAAMGSGTACPGYAPLGDNRAKRSLMGCPLGPAQRPDRAGPKGYPVRERCLPGGMVIP